VRGEAVSPRVIGGATKVACILGWPASHSLSPAMHNAAFEAAGLDWVYVAYEVPPETLPEAVAGVRALGIAGANITMPHKQTVLPLLDGVSDEVSRIGAVNTIVNESGRLIGANTDGHGFVRYLERDLGRQLGGAPVTLLGAGGSARSLAAALGSAGAKVTVVARRAEAAGEVAALAGADAGTRGWDQRADGLTGIVVSTIPSGSGSPLPPEALAGADLVIDLAYAPAVTALMRSAAAAGIETHNGLGMLLHQAVLAFELWTGKPAPEAAMSAALVLSLGSRSDDAEV
jgi:shikimate dehydrogenase